MGSDDDMIDAIRAAGDATGERIWPMPLVAEHKQAMRSSVADLKNSGGRDAGASTAAGFLSNFVGDTPWVHLDIAGTGWSSKQTPCHRGGATGVTVRSLVGWLCQQLAAGRRD
jgi:leucyl aminopeptidase